MRIHIEARVQAPKRDVQGAFWYIPRVVALPHRSTPIYFSARHIGPIVAAGVAVVCIFLLFYVLKLRVVLARMVCLS